MGYTAVARRERQAWSGAGIAVARDYLTDLALLLAALVLAAHFRQTFPLGGAHDDDRRRDLTIAVLVATALAVAHLARLAVGPESRAATRRFWAPLAAAAVTAVAIAGFVPEHSGVQTLYFLVAAGFLVVTVVPWPVRWASGDRRPDLLAGLRGLWGRRGLLRLWVSFSIHSRYSQSVLGILWVVLLPLVSAVVMSIVFSQLLSRSVGDVPFISFLLAGFIPFTFFRQCMILSSRSIVQSMGLMNQVYFPREIVVIATLGETLFDLVVMFATALVVNAVVGLWPTPHLVFVPILVVIQTAFTLGLMLIVAWLGALIRDVPNMIQLGLQVIFYLSAVIYPKSIVPDRYRWILDLNPIVVLIDSYRDVLIYGRAPDWIALLYPAALGVGLLAFGYRVFKAHEDTMADLL